MVFGGGVFACGVGVDGLPRFVVEGGGYGAEEVAGSVGGEAARAALAYLSEDGTGEYGAEEISELLGTVVPEGGVNGGVISAVEAGGAGGVFGVLFAASGVEDGLGVGGGGVDMGREERA